MWRGPVDRIGTLPGKKKLLWVSDGPAPANVRAAAEGWDILSCRAEQPFAAKLAEVPLAMVCPNGAANDLRLMGHILKELDQACAVTIFLLPPEAQTARQMLSRRRGQFMCLRQDAPAEELSATLKAVALLEPAIHNLQAQLVDARSIGKPAGESAGELDEQMRLAARLQRDFLPRRLPEVGAVRFAVFYRPASWVSGDIYDVARLDETHIGFYVTDAIGHGMPAALLTMFIKRALQTKRIFGNSYQIIPPHEALEQLNADICEQNLSSCQFCTTAYCIVDVASLALTYSRAGHPEPLLIHADGSVEKLLCPGMLLGVFPKERYESRQKVLAVGDRLLLFSDGAETALCRGPAGPSLETLAKQWAGVPRQEMLLQIAALIDTRAAKCPIDDITLLVMDVI